jgi:hypothetical protein
VPGVSRAVMDKRFHAVRGIAAQSAAPFANSLPSNILVVL